MHKLHAQQMQSSIEGERMSVAAQAIVIETSSLVVLWSTGGTAAGRVCRANNAM
jgi:hypothetical protein